MFQINAVRFRKLPWGPALPWAWLPRLRRGGQFRSRYKQRWRQLWMLYWGWWRVEFFLR